MVPARARYQSGNANGIAGTVPPRADLLRREFSKAHVTHGGGRFAEQPAELRDRDARALVRAQVLHDPLGERQDLRTATRQGAEPTCSEAPSAPRAWW